VRRSASTRREGHKLAWIAWSAVCFFWGTTFLGIKIALETMPPFVMGGTRYVLAGVTLALILRLRGHRLPDRSSWFTLAVLGFFMMVLGNGGVVWGEQFVPTGLAAVVVGTSPFWMVSVNALMPHGDRLHARQWAGLAVGFCGILLLLWPEISLRGGDRHGFVLGVISLEIACGGWAIGSNYTRRHVMPDDVLGSAALQMAFGGAMMTIVGLATGEWSRLAVNPRTASAWLYLAVFGSIVGFAAYSYALQHLPVTIVSMYTFVNPIIAVTLGTLILGEPFHLRMLAAAAIIIVGILIVGPTLVKNEPTTG
jgi:drug/metabolite transporter (DMT)-like permease